MDHSATKLKILDKFKEDEADFGEISRIEESELLQSPKFKRLQSSSSSSPRSTPPSPSSPNKTQHNENLIGPFDSVPKLKFKSSSPFLKSPSKRRTPLQPSNRQAQYHPQSPTLLKPAHPPSTKKMQSNFSKALISLTPAQRLEKRPGRVLTTSDILSSYEFKETVGRGAFANVYRAINRLTGDEVAIKEIFIEDDDNILEMMQEIDLLKILKHNNIVKYHGFIRNEKKMLIFLEYCSGGSLRHLYKKVGPLSETKVIELMKQVIAGLVYLHEQGVVHRDVKAANILLTHDGNVKLTDFGVSTKISSNTIKTFSIAGTPNWMAPEIISMDGTSTASDIWSLGATVVELLTAQPLYSNLNEMAVLHAIVTDDYPPIPEFISPLCRDFLRRCFEKQPKFRWTAQQILRHDWLNKNDTAKSTQGKHEKKMFKNLKFDGELEVEQDFSSINRIRTTKFLPMSKGTSRNEDFDDFLDKELSSDFNNCEFTEVSSQRSCGNMFEPFKHQFGRELGPQKPFVTNQIPTSDTVAKLFTFLETNSTKKLIECVDQVLIFNTLQWIKKTSDISVLEKYLLLVEKYVSVNVSDLVELGSVLLLSKFVHKCYPLSIRAISVNILDVILQDEVHLRVFVQCGAFESILVLLHEPYVNEGIFLRFTTSLIVRALKSTMLSRSTVILILSSFEKLLDWISVVLLQFVSFNELKPIDQLMIIIPELLESKLFEIQPIFLNSIYRTYDKLSLKNQAIAMKCFKQMDASSFEDTHELLKFMVKGIRKSIALPLNDDITQLLDAATSVILNICHLDEEMQTKLVRMDIIPTFRKLLSLNLACSKSIIPLVCEFALNTMIVPLLMQEDVLSDYRGFLLNPVWQANVMDSLTSLNEKLPGDQVPLMLLNDPDMSLRKAVLTEKALNYELFLEKLIRFLSFYRKSISVNQIRLSLLQDNAVVESITNRISSTYANQILIQINLFKLLKILVLDNYNHPNYNKIIFFAKEFKTKDILLIDRLVKEILIMDSKKGN